MTKPIRFTHPIQANIKCPHCRNSIFAEPRPHEIEEDNSNFWMIASRVCPSCHKAILELFALGTNEAIQIYPKGSSRPAPPLGVPTAIAQDFNEAALVLPDSPKAAAALARRCLQHLLREVAGVKGKDLCEEIQLVLPKLPIFQHLLMQSDTLAMLRHIQQNTFLLVTS